MVKVSVIVPVYNTEKMLEDCIKSLICQTLQEIQIIFIDDGSTDNSVAILRRYQRYDNRIHILYNGQNMGGARSRNRGLCVAEGQYILFVDSDDYIESDTLENLYAMCELQDADMCYLGMQFHLEPGMDRPGGQHGIRGSYPDVYKGTDLMKQFTENKEFFLYLCSVFYRRSFIEKSQLKFKKLLIGEGGDFILRALCRAEKVLVCSENYYHYRVHGDSVMHSLNAKRELLTGQIVQYADMLYDFAWHENSKGLEVFLADLQKKISGGIQNLTADERVEIEGQLETGYTKHVFHLLQKNTHIYGIKFDDEILNRIRKKDSVIVYGAGYASREVLDLLHLYSVEIIGFAVTRHKKGQTSMYGHHIYEIQELAAYRDTAVVLVSSNKIYNQEIQHTLETYGFKEYIFLNIEI